MMGVRLYTAIGLRLLLIVKDTEILKEKPSNGQEHQELWTAREDPLRVCAAQAADVNGKRIAQPKITLQ